MWQGWWCEEIVREVEERGARSEEREARSRVTILLKREARSEKRGVLNNAPEIEVGAVV